MNPYLLPVMEFGPTVMARMISQIEEPRLDECLSQGRFSPREVVAHMADWEPIMRARMEQALQSPGSTVEIWDEGELAIKNGYASSDIKQQLATYTGERRKTAEFLRGLPADAWEKFVVHPERGLMTVYDQATMMIGHDMYHVEQLSSYLADKTFATW